MLINALSLLLSSGLVFAASTFPALTYSTYLRDSFTPKAIATDSAGNIYLTGNAIVDPATSQSTVLVVKLNPQASQYLYVRYLGGSVKDSANAIAVDSAGNAYIAGSTTSPDFPVTSGGNLATAPGPFSQRSFVAKLDPSGGLVFSSLLGGSAASAAQAIAINAAGQIIVTGAVSGDTGPAFPSTTGAYSIAKTANHPYLLELDPTGTKVVFSATGIGGSAVALDPSGNIYVAGSTYLLDYPTTPGAYQPTLPAFRICDPPCSGSYQGANQYVTKVDPTGSTLIYSTAVSGSGNTTNSGLAVNAAGAVYLTGYAGTSYPYTVTPPTTPMGGFTNFELPFLTKLDAAGKALLFSVPVGGSGVGVDARGFVAVGGGVGYGFAPGGFGITNNVPALASVPSKCLPDNSATGLGIRSSAYVSEIDGTSGDVLGSQFIGGSTLAIAGLAITGTTAWIAGTTPLPDFPITPGAITLPNLGPEPLSGAYLGAVQFSQLAPPATPQISCIIDAADLMPTTAAAPYQLLTIVGTGLGPATGVSAPDVSTTSLAGVNINFGSVSAPLLYVSSTQINFAVPLVDYGQAFGTMRLTVDSAIASPRQLPLTFENPSLFVAATAPPVPSFGAVAFALNADGSVNSSTNPARLGATLSVFANGLTRDPRVNSSPPQLSTTSGWSVIGSTPANPFVLRVDLRVPSSLVNFFSCDPSSLCAVGFTLYDPGSVYTGAVVSGGKAFGGVVYIDRSR